MTGNSGALYSMLKHDREQWRFSMLKHDREHAGDVGAMIQFPWLPYFAAGLGPKVPMGGWGGGGRFTHGDIQGDLFKDK